MIRLKNALAYACVNGQRFEAELCAFIRFASVSTQPHHEGDTARCGAGVKAAIPSRAVAKLNFRLVLDQDPTEIDRLFRETC
jgi:hypothetical protein